MTETAWGVPVPLNLDELVWPGRHQPVFAANGTVATSQPLAAGVGVEILREGGNALDAAVAMAAALTVVEAPTSSIGGDAFALVWDGERLHGLNGSGRAPSALSAEVVRELGFDAMPERGWLPVTVPGVPAAWRDLHRRFGRLPFARLLQPASDYAERGHPVSPISAWHWQWEVDEENPKLRGDEVAGFLGLYAPGGRAPRVGEIWRSRELADSLRLIAETNGDTVYTGEIAERIVGFAEATGGLVAAGDLAAHASTWVEPISTRYRGFDVWEIPPNAQGIATLIALNILEGFDLASLPRNSGDSFHIQIEAMKLGFADTYRHVSDPDRVDVPVAELLAKDYAASRRELIGERALLAAPGDLGRGDTVYLCTADRDGMMVSYIQSSNSAFGSHVVVPGTGIVLQNRGAEFSLDPDHPNYLEPGKRSFHTIIPGFLTKDGEPVGPFGVMQGSMQPQGHVQMVVNTVDYRMDPQTSLDQPRWYWRRDRRVLLEPTVHRGGRPPAPRPRRPHLAGARRVWARADHLAAPLRRLYRRQRPPRRRPSGRLLRRLRRLSPALAERRLRCWHSNSSTRHTRSRSTTSAASQPGGFHASSRPKAGGWRLRSGNAVVMRGSPACSRRTFERMWAIPGGFKRPAETLDEAAKRELLEETGVESAGLLRQFGAYGDPGRDPRMNVVTVAYFAVLRDVEGIAAGTDAADAALLPAGDVLDGEVELAFDHARIVRDAVERVRVDLALTGLATAFVGPAFTLAELRAVYEAVWGTRLDAANFRRSLLAEEGWVVPTGRRARPGAAGGKPAELYRAGSRWRDGGPIRHPHLADRKRGHA